MKAEERRQDPKDDIMTTLATVEMETDDEPRRLNDAEILSIIQQLQVAGKETTAHLIGSTMLLFLENRDQLEAVQNDPSLIGNMTEEALRVESPVRALFRTTTREVELGGVTLPERTLMMLIYAAANRDEKEFENAPRVRRTARERPQPGRLQCGTALLHRVSAGADGDPGGLRGSAEADAELAPRPGLSGAQAPDELHPARA